MGDTETSAAGKTPNLVYCRCTYARVVPRQVKDGVLEALAGSGVDFDAVPDLCEMSARKDPRLAEIAGGKDVTIAACYPRAVRWLFSSAGAPLANERVRILNMREETAEAVAAAMLTPDVNGAGTAGAPDVPAADHFGRSSNEDAGTGDGGNS